MGRLAAEKISLYLPDKSTRPMFSIPTSGLRLRATVECQKTHHVAGCVRTRNKNTGRGLQRASAETLTSCATWRKGPYLKQSHRDEALLVWKDYLVNWFLGCCGYNNFVPHTILFN